MCAQQWQVGVLNSEKEVLEEAAASANAKAKELREAMAAQHKQLGQLQVLPPRLQDMQEQVCCLAPWWHDRLGVSRYMISSLQTDHGSGAG